MKIAYVLQSSKGGIPHYTACLANAVSKYADVVLLKPDKTTADGVFSSRVEIVNAFKSANLSYVDLYRKRFISFRTFGHLLSYKNIKIVRNIKPDIIRFAGGLIPPMQAFIRLYKLDKLFPLIVTFHDVPPRKYLVLPKKISETLILVAINVMNFLDLLMPKIKYEKVIVHTQKNRERLIERGSPSEKIVVIPHGAYDFFKKYGNYSKMEEERNCILFFGNIVEAKAVDVLIDAIPIIAKKIPDVKLVIAGDGVIPEKSWMKMKAVNHKLMIRPEGTLAL
ncbi:MAG: glycosyltransferase family 4 protein [Archaeoglobales archaeon]|nr:glycosyltransferase family 4 protein [Archaeoglobales archaeon]